MLLGSSFRQTVHTHHASVRQAVKFVAALLRVAGVTAQASRKVMAAYRRVYDSHHLQADQLRNPTLGSRVWATFLHPRAQFGIARSSVYPIAQLPWL